MKNSACIFTLILAVTANFNVRADTFTWQGDRNNNWDNSSNWRQDPGDGGVPGPGDTIFLKKDAAGFRLDLGNSTDVREVTAVTFETNGSTGSGGYNWEFLDGTLEVASSGLADVTWMHSSATGGTVTVAGAINFTDPAGSNEAADFVGGDGGPQTLALASPISGPVVLSFNCSAHGSDDTIRLDANSPDFTGDVKINSGTFFLNHANALPNATVYLLGSGNLAFIDGATVNLYATNRPIDLPAGKTLKVKAPGVGQTYSTLTGSGTFNLLTGVATFLNTSGFTGTLDLDADAIANGASLSNVTVDLGSGATLACVTTVTLGRLIGQGSLAVANGVTVTIGSKGVINAAFGGGLKTYQSQPAGSVILSATGAEYALQYDGTLADAFDGQLEARGNLTIGTTTFQKAALTMTGGAELLLPSGGTTSIGSLNTGRGFALSSNLTIGTRNEDMLITGDLTGSGDFTKTGSGTLTLAGNNSSTGKTTIDVGTLDLTGPISFGGDFENNATVVMEVTGNSAETVIVAGQLDVTGSTLQLNITGEQTAQAIILFTYDSLIGTFATVTSIPYGYTIDYGWEGHSVALVDTTSPRLLSQTGVAGQALPTFDLTFNEGILGFDAADLQVNAPGFSGTPQFNITSLGGNSYRVTVSGLFGSGVIRLGFSSGANFTDPNGNAFLSSSGTTINVLGNWSDFSRSAVTSSETFSINVPENTGFLILAASASGSNSYDNTTEASIAGQSMQLITHNTTGGTRRTAVFLLKNPPVGQRNITISFPISEGSGGFLIVGSALFVNGLDEANPVAQAGQTTSSGSGILLNPVMAGDLTVQVASRYPSSAGIADLSVNGQSDYPGKTRITNQARGYAHIIEQQTTEALDLDFDQEGAAVVFRGAAVLDYSNAAPVPSITYAVGTASPTNATTAAFNVSFSEPVTGLSASDFVVTFPGGTTGTPTLSGAGASYTLTVPNVTGNGTLTVSLPAGTVLDAGGAPNSNAAGPLPVIIDQTPPQMTLNQPRTMLTNADSVIFDVSFNEAVTNFGGAVLNATSGIAYTGIQTAGSGSAYTVTVSGLSGDGFFSLDFNLGSTRDIAGNLLNSKIVSGAVTLDNTPPVITLNGSVTVTLALHGTYAESGAQATDAVDGSSAATVGGDTVNGSVPGNYTIIYNATDAAGNAATQITRTVLVLDARQTWSGGRSLTSGVNDGFFDDPNGDGRKNIEHFALDTNPLGNGTDEGKTVLSMLPDGGAENYLTYTIPVRKGTVFSGAPLTSAPIDGIIYTIHSSTSLTASDLAVVERTTATDTASLPVLGDYDAAPGADYEYRTFRLTTSTGATQRGFVWIEIYEAP